MRGHVDDIVNVFGCILYRRAEICKISGRLRRVARRRVFREIGANAHEIRVCAPSRARAPTRAGSVRAGFGTGPRHAPGTGFFAHGLTPGVY